MRQFEPGNPNHASIRSVDGSTVEMEPPTAMTREIKQEMPRALTRSDPDRPATRSTPGGPLAVQVAAGPARTSAHSASTFDVAIAGGGIAGSLAALTLARILGPDVRIAVIDPAPRFSAGRDDPRASSLAASSKNLLVTVGVWERIAAESQPIHAIELTDARLDDAVRPILLTYDNALEDDDTPALDREPASYIVENAQLASAIVQETLSERGITSVVGRLEAVTVSSGPIAIETTAGALKAELLIGADGARSPTRGFAGIKTVQSDHGQSAIVTMVRVEQDHHGVARQNFLPGGPFAILPMTAQRCCITWSDRTREVRRLMALDAGAFLGEVERRFGAALGALEVVRPPTAFPLTTLMARAIVADRVALVGDAARLVHPIAGQGLNHAIKDVAALTECIVDAARVGLSPGDQTVLTRYGRWRRFDSVTSAFGYAALNTLFSNDIGALRAVRDAGLGLVDRTPALKRRLVREAAGLTGAGPKLLRGDLV